MPTVSIEGQTETYQLIEGDIIFDALEKRGKELPHGCLAGSCGVCKIFVTEGAENLEEPSLMEKNTIDAIKNHLTVTKGEDYLAGKTIRLSCRAKIKGNIKLEPF